MNPNAKTRDEFLGVLAVAGIQVLKMRALTDGYDLPATDPRHWDNPSPRCWWFFKTPYGWIEMGWRKRVISIDWSDLGLDVVVTEDEVTKGEKYVHAWTLLKAAEYLTRLREAAEELGEKSFAPIGTSASMKYVTCETAAAITVHVRILADGEEPKYTGVSGPKETLCGARVGWDTRIPIAAVSCRDCLEEMYSRPPGDEPLLSA